MWETLTEPQAILLSSLITVIAAVMGVLLGWWLFAGKVKSLAEAVEHTEGILNGHKDATTNTLNEIVQQVASSLEAINTLRGQIADQVAAQEVAPILAEASILEARDTVEAYGELGEIETLAAPDRSAVVDAWDSIRAEIERLAADPGIDGRTRAKYSRVDRRSYKYLIDLMDWDGTIPNPKANQLREAHEIWMSYRNGRRQVSVADLNRLLALKETLVPH